MSTRRASLGRLFAPLVLPMLPVLLVLLVLLAACGSASTDEGPTLAGSAAESTDASTDPTGERESAPIETPAFGDAAKPEGESFTPVKFNNDFSESIVPIVVENCSACHSPGGPGSPHLALDSAQDLVDTHFLITGAVTSERMPPWPASEASVPFHETRSLRTDQIQAIADWSAAGAPLDVDGATLLPAPAEINRLQDPDLVVTPEAYAGDPSNIDDYRCLIYDLGDEGGWITGVEFLPDQLEVVHHAIGYLVGSDSAERAQQKNGSDGKPGWQCYGGSGVGNDEIFLGWAPGQEPTRMPEGAGFRYDAGDFIVMQIHYHYEGSAPLDASSLALTLATTEELAELGGPREVVVASAVAPVEIPCATWETGPLCERAAAVADANERFNGEGLLDFITYTCGFGPEDFAGFTDGVVQSSCTQPASFIGADGELFAILGHMHEIGDWFRMTLNAGTPDEVVLLDIPDWDFDWQYNYRPVETFIVEEDDWVTIECGWDRARRDPALEPAWILWADGTNDEMCFATLTVIR